MRTIPAEVQTLLKSRMMAGANAHNHAITITGAPVDTKLLDPTDWTIWRTFVGDSPARTYGNMTEASDERAVCIYGEGDIDLSGDIKIAFAPSVAEVLNGTETFDYNNAVTIISNVKTRRASINMVEGKLCVAISYINGSSDHVAEFWQDTDGNGTGLAKVSDISTDLSPEATYDSGADISLVYQLPGGAYVVLVPWAEDVMRNARCFYSINSGASWTMGTNLYNSLLLIVADISRNILPLSDTSFVVYTAYSEGTVGLTYFTNNGATKSWIDFEDSWTPWGVGYIQVSEHYYMCVRDGAKVDIYELNYDTPTSDNITSLSGDWTLVISVTAEIDAVYFFTIAQNALIVQHNAAGVRISGAGTTAINQRRAKRIEINRNRGMASSLTLNFDNKNGLLSPDGTGDWNEVLFPFVQVKVKQGYGTNLVDTFLGNIDDIIMTTFPQEIILSCRNKMYKALDQLITDESDKHSVYYTDTAPETIFGYLAAAAGFSTVYVEATGLVISKGFSWESYADAFSWLADLCGYEWYVDEAGALYFHLATDRQPEKEDEVVVLNGTTPVDLEKYPVVTDSIRVWSGAGETGTKYILNSDYTITEGDHDTAWQITRIPGGSIGDGGTVYVTYVYAAYVFSEGEDIISIGYTISGGDLYYQVIVHGEDEDGNVIEVTADYISRDYYNVPEQKILKIDAPEANTEAKCQKIADRAEYMMRSRARICEFAAAVGVPWLQVGDCIMIVETSTTISEIYRIIDMTLIQSPDEGFIMRLTTYHYGYSVA